MRKILFIMSVMALLVGATPAFAGIFTIDTPTAALFGDKGVSAGDSGSLEYTGYSPGTLAANKISGTAAIYGAIPMVYNVGFAGSIQDTDNSGFADIYIGVSNVSAAGGPAILDGSVTGLELAISNDNQQIWNYRLYAKEAGGTHYSDTWLSLPAGDQSTLDLAFVGGYDGSDVTEFGFVVQFEKATTGGGTNLSDDFHTSVVPVPGALLIGLLGLGTAGMKLRKRA